MNAEDHNPQLMSSEEMSKMDNMDKTTTSDLESKCEGENKGLTPRDVSMSIRELPPDPTPRRAHSPTCVAYTHPISCPRARADRLALRARAAPHLSPPRSH
jgi:hypothetical protein